MKNTPGDAPWYLVESDILQGEKIVLVIAREHLDAAREHNQGRVLYSGREIETIYPFKEDIEFILAVHRIKKAFGGWIRPEAKG